jgi:hypothetical protein
MTSNRQIEANRINAQRSIGPKTAQGKNERVAMLCVIRAITEHHGTRVCYCPRRPIE